MTESKQTIELAKKRLYKRYIQPKHPRTKRKKIERAQAPTIILVFVVKAKHLERTTRERERYFVDNSTYNNKYSSSNAFRSESEILFFQSVI